MLQNYINGLSTQTLLDLYQECEQFSESGILPEDAVLRRLLASRGVEDIAFNLERAINCIYRALATRYVKEVANVKV